MEVQTTLKILCIGLRLYDVFLISDFWSQESLILSGSRPHPAWTADVHKRAYPNLPEPSSGAALVCVCVCVFRCMQPFDKTKWTKFTKSILSWLDPQQHLKASCWKLNRKSAILVQSGPFSIFGSFSGVVQRQTRLFDFSPIPTTFEPHIPHGLSFCRCVLAEHGSKA